MNDDKRRYVPWSREADKTAAIIAAILALLGGDILSSTGALRVGKFARSDFDREIAFRDSKIAELEAAMPDYFPPIEWQLAETLWKTSVHAQLEAISVLVDTTYTSLVRADSSVQKRVDELYQDCTQHNEEAELWKRKIEQNTNNIDNLRQRDQQGLNK